MSRAMTMEIREGRGVGMYVCMYIYAIILLYYYTAILYDHGDQRGQGRR
jgi:hypothetical protein